MLVSDLGQLSTWIVVLSWTCVLFWHQMYVWSWHFYSDWDLLLTFSILNFSLIHSAFAANRLALGWRTSTSSELVFCCLSKTHHPLHPYLRRIANINYQINLAVIHVCFQCPRRTRRLICRLYDPFIHLLYSQGSHRRSYVRPLALVFGECQSDF